MHYGIKKGNASNTHFNTHFSAHYLWLVKIHTRPTKYIWDPHDMTRLMWILTHQRECVEKCALKCMLLAFLKSLRSLDVVVWIRISGLLDLCVWILKWLLLLHLSVKKKWKLNIIYFYPINKLLNENPKFNKKKERETSNFSILKTSNIHTQNQVLWK